MVSTIDHLKCTGCTACYTKCPVGCISMKADNEGFLYPQIQTDSCIKCGMCDTVCPVLNKSERSVKQETGIYAAQNLNIMMRKQSTSGGIFTLLAERTIHNGGVVFGAAFDEDCYSVSHTAIMNNEELGRLRLSKYLQSNKKNIYAETENTLKEGKQVLFTGTPCEIAGLKQFLGKGYDNLLCVDLVCHGVPSQKIWKGYLKNFESEYGGKVNKVNFRDKTHYIQNHRIIRTKEGKDVLFSQGTDPYMLMFLRNYSLRPSCYRCDFKGDNYHSDITLGDFWGIGTACPEMQDGIGTSLVITRTKQGQSVLHKIEPLLNLKAVELSTVSTNNTALIEPVKEPEDRAAFFHNLQNGGINMIRKYIMPRERGIIERVTGTKVGLLLLSIKHGRKINPSETDFCVRYTINSKT